MHAPGEHPSGEGLDVQPLHRDQVMLAHEPCADLVAICVPGVLDSGVAARHLPTNLRPAFTALLAPRQRTLLPAHLSLGTLGDFRVRDHLPGRERGQMCQPHVDTDLLARGRESLARYA